VIKAAAILILAGLVLIAHAIRRGDRVGFESGAFLFVVMELVGGVLCAFAGLVTAGIAILF
jgi:hypothetical protein